MPIYMQYEGIKGDVTTPTKYAGWIKLESSQLGVHRHITAPTGRLNKKEIDSPIIEQIVITKFVDNTSSTKLFKEAIAGKGKKVTIVFLEADAKDKNKLTPYLTIELENVDITSFSVSGHGGDKENLKPMEAITLSFTKINYVTAATSSIENPQSVQHKASWDLATQKLKDN